MINRLLCLFFGHPKKYELSDMNIQFTPTSAIPLFKLCYCMRCKELYAKQLSK